MKRPMGEPRLDTTVPSQGCPTDPPVETRDGAAFTSLETAAQTPAARRSASMLFGLIFGLATFGSGCSDSISSADTSGEIPAAAGQSVPQVELGDLPPNLALTPEQTQSMQVALDEFNAARTRRHEEFRSQMGKRGEQGRRSFRDGSRNESRGEPPFLTFIEKSAEILEPEQFDTFAAYLSENADVWRPGGRDAQWGAHRGGQSGPDRGKHFGSDRGGKHDRGPGARWGRALDMTEQQREQVREAMSGFRDEMRSLVHSVEAGEMTAEAALSQGTALVEKRRTALAAVLTPDQLSKMEEFRGDRFDKRLERRSENLDESLTRRATFLDRVLGLDDTQAEQVKAALIATIPARQSLLEEVKNGTLDPHVAPLRILEIEQGALTQIRAALTPAQQSRLDTMKDLLPRGFAGRWR